MGTTSSSDSQELIEQVITNYYRILCNMQKQFEKFQNSLSDSVKIHSQSNIDLESIQHYIQNIEDDLMYRIEHLSHNLNGKRKDIRKLKNKVKDLKLQLVDYRLGLEEVVEENRLLK